MERSFWRSTFSRLGRHPSVLVLFFPGTHHSGPVEFLNIKNTNQHMRNLMQRRAAPGAVPRRFANAPAQCERAQRGSEKERPRHKTKMQRSGTVMCDTALEGPVLSEPEVRYDWIPRDWQLCFGT